MRREITGKHMAIIIVSGFGIVMTVNLLMATLAIRGFGGVIVENSYVASQNFNGWLDAAQRQKALGWSASVTRSEHGHLLLETSSVPDGSTITAVARRPLGRPQTTTLDFFEEPAGRYVATRPLGPGRWIVRLRIVSPDRRSWASEERLP